MSERATKSGDGEIATCHVCDRTFGTQEELLLHLEAAHEGELLREMNEEAPGV